MLQTKKLIKNSTKLKKENIFIEVSKNSHSKVENRIETISR